MEEYEKLVQDIIDEFLSRDGYSVFRIDTDHILVGFCNYNFLLEVMPPLGEYIPEFNWHGEVKEIDSFEQALSYIMLTCLPF